MGHDVRVNGAEWGSKPIRLQLEQPSHSTTRHSVTGELSLVHDGVEPEWGIAHARAKALELAIMAGGRGTPMSAQMSAQEMEDLQAVADRFFNYIYQEHLAVKAVGSVEEEQDDV